MLPQSQTYLQQIILTEKLDAVVFFGLSNIRYLSGFTGTDAILIVSGEETVFLTDSRYIEQAHNQVSADRIACYKNKIISVVDILKEQGDLRIGFDASMVNYAQYAELKTIAGDSLSLIPLVTQLQSLRAVKTKDELSALRKAASLNYRAYNQVVPLIKPGITERQIALEFEFALKRLGGEVNAFDFIVASGKRGALPHGVASDKLISAGELVTIDFGTRVSGYHSDETVTLAVGEIDRKLRQIFDIVLEAHDSALDAICPDLPICELDAVARNIIAEHGYGKYFGHGLGHGVGLEVHEYPSVSERNSHKLQVGMVITIEPGIYLPGLGGVRIEDTVVVIADGYDSITEIPKQFKQLKA